MKRSKRVKRVKRYKKINRPLGSETIKCIECGKPIDQSDFIQWIFETCGECFQ